jgi:SAM-dependent methyltransferase
MSKGLELVKAINAAARRAGVADFVAQFENIATHAQYRVAYEKTAERVRRGDCVLDWGCGNGHFSLLLESLGARVTGYSFEPPPRSMAGSTSFTFVPGDTSDPRLLPFPDRTFDTAVSMGVLEHVGETGGDERVSLAELGRVLKPGGTLLTFHLPNRTGWIEEMVRLLRLNKYVHPRRFDRKDIGVLWDNAGFSILDIGLYNILPRAELRLLPGFVRHSPAFSAAYDAVDDTLARIASRACTNFFIVAQRRPSA